MAIKAKKIPPASTPAKPVRVKKVAVVAPPVVVEHVSAYSVGNRVSHPTFGDGKVTAITRDQLSIKFENSEKVILESFVKLASKG